MLYNICYRTPGAPGETTCLFKVNFSNCASMFCFWQEAIQDIIDVFVAASMSNANTVRKEPDQPTRIENISVPMISPSETSSVQSFFPPDTSRVANNRIISQTSPILSQPLKRKLSEAVSSKESSGHQKKAKQAQSTPAAPIKNLPFAPTDALPRKRNRSKLSLMTPEDDAYIWQAYMAHKETVDKLKLGKNASAGLAKRIAEKLHTNWQTVGVRLKHLQKLNRDNSEHPEQTSPRREVDVNSLEGGGIDGGGDHTCSSESGSEDSSSIDSESDLGESSPEKDLHGRTETTGTRDNLTTSGTTPPCSLHSIVPHQLAIVAPPRPDVGKKRTHSKLTQATQAVSAPETPLSAPPHIARKTTFTHDDDVVLWNAYLRNGCEAPTESQLQKLVKKLNRNSTSGRK